MLKPSRRQFAVLLLALVLLGGWLLLRNGSGGDDASAPVAEVVTGSVEEVVTAQGKLEPKEYVDVGAQVSGQLKKIHIEIGDVVKKGDLLAEIDPRVYESRVEASRARLRTLEAQRAEAAAQAVFAKQQFDRNKRLIGIKAISQEALEESQTGLKVADSGVSALKAQIDEVKSTLSGDEANLSYTKIFAPMDGTITTQPTREGQTVNASQSAPVIVQVANLDLMTVRAQVAEADVMQLTPGMEVSFTTLGGSDKRWKGRVDQILPTPETINDVVLYNALVDVENKERQLMTGMSTQMFFELGKAENVPVIPVSALGKRLREQDNEKGQAYVVRVKSGGSTAERTVHIGRMSRSVAEVRDGLAVGDKVALPPKQQPTGTRQGGGPGMRGPRL